MDRRQKKLDQDGLWNYALRILGVRAYSAAELKRKLLARAELPSDVPAAMEKLREYGFADDRKYAESFASARLANEGFGRFRVLRELRAKQVSPTVAEQAIAQAFSGVEEQKLADEFLARKYRSRNLPEYLAEEKNLASAYRRLRTAGFSSTVTLAALKRHRQQIEEWDEPEEPVRD